MKTELEIARERVASLNEAPKRSTHSRMFLLDGSGSMQGFKMMYAKEALKKHMKPGDGILVFDDTVHYIPEKFIDNITPGNLTAMLPALKEALTYKCIHIILISDGQPNKGGDTFEVTDFVRHSIRGVKIDTIGIGDDCEQEFLASISDFTNGTTVHIDDPEQLTGVVGLLTCGDSINL